MARPFRWTQTQLDAFDLLCTQRFTQAEVAARVGVSRRTIEGWVRRRAWRTRYIGWNRERIKVRDAAWRATWREMYSCLPPMLPRYH